MAKLLAGEKAIYNMFIIYHACQCQDV